MNEARLRCAAIARRYLLLALATLATAYALQGASLYLAAHYSYVAGSVLFGAFLGALTVRANLDSSFTKEIP